MYLVKFNRYSEQTGRHYEWIWEESFRSLTDAVRFGMWKYRIWSEIESFKTIKIEPRMKHITHLW